MGQARWLKRMLIWVVPVILLPAALLGTATMVNAHGGDQNLIHACVNPSGLTRLVGANESCSPSERPVHWPAASGTQGGSVTVIDSLGNTVGPLVQSNAVAVTVGGKRYLVGVGADGFRNIAGTPTLFYVNQNCPPGGELIQLNGATNIVIPILQLAGTIGYYGDVGSPLYTGSVASRKSFNSALGSFDPCSNSASSGQFVPAKTISLPAFTPRFSVK